MTPRECQGWEDSTCQLRCARPATHYVYPPADASSVPSVGCERHAREWLAAWQRQGWADSWLERIVTLGSK